MKLVYCICAVVALAWLPTVGQAAHPNIVFILADDMGFGDVQGQNPDSQIPTPNLDRLASEGMTFTDAHSPSAVCTPTRYGLITGRYCWRSRLKSGVLNGYGTPLIETDRPTVASFLGSQGYHCGVVGKWHLGLGFAKKSESNEDLDFSKPVNGGPNALGFDESYVIPASLDFPPYVFVQNGAVTEQPSIDQPAVKFPAFVRAGPRSSDFVLEDCLDILLKQAVSFIDANANQQKPFFLYFPLTAPHKPVLPHPRFRGKTELGPYGDFVVQVDWTVGQVLKALDDADVADETLVVYSSDNGSFMYRLDETEADHVADNTIQGFRDDHHTANHIFRGTKADIWEAGHHVPFLARWPGRIKPGSQCDTTICLTDFFATAGEIVGADPPDGAAPDSYSLLPLFDSNPDQHKRPPVIHHSAAGMFAIRDGEWKLVLGNGSGGRQLPRGKPFERPFQLFNLANDLREQHEVLKQHPDIAARLEQACEAIRAGSSGE